MNEYDDDMRELNELVRSISREMDRIIDAFGPEGKRRGIDEAFDILNAAWEE